VKVTGESADELLIHASAPRGIAIADTACCRPVALAARTRFSTPSVSLAAEPCAQKLVTRKAP
jgi:hypothetical protein